MKNVISDIKQITSNIMLFGDLIFSNTTHNGTIFILVGDGTVRCTCLSIIILSVTPTQECFIFHALRW